MIYVSSRRFAILKWFEDVCACVHSTGIVRNELICEYANVVHTSSSFRPHTLTRIIIPFEDGSVHF